MPTKKLSAALLVTLMAFSSNALHAGEYPIQARKEGQTAFFDVDKAPKEANKSYPAWYRGHGENGRADEDARYFYRELIGPSSFVNPGLHSDRFYMGTLELDAGETYPAHNHPAPEIYYVLSGKADWYVNDEKEHVTPGSIIYHRPYAVHGWKNTGDEPLRVAWMWWAGDDLSVLNKSAHFVNPTLFEDEDTVEPHAVPIPPVRARASDMPKDQWETSYPVPGRLAGETAFFHVNAAAKKANSSYPDWLRGNAKNGLANKSSRYWYRELIGPERFVHSRLNDENLYAGTLTLTEGTTYPAHNHPASEIYFVLQGHAKWYVNDEVQQVGPGSLMYHRPFAAHGWVNTGNKPLKVLWAWWSEDGGQSVFDKGARMINPKLVNDEEKVEPHAVPIPEPISD